MPTVFEHIKALTGLFDYKWGPSRSGGMTKLYSESVEAGNDTDGSTIFVGRARHYDDYIPAKVVRGVAYVPYEGEEHVKTEFDWLVVETAFSKHEWIVRSGGDDIPKGSIQTCSEPCNDILYIGRANFKGSLMTGAISTQHKCIFVPYGGKAHKITGEHEILIVKRK